MKKLCYILLLVFSFSGYSQENQLYETLKNLDDNTSQLKYVLNLKIPDIPENGFSKLLKIKLNSELNSLGDVFAFFANGKELNLSQKEQSILTNRARYFATWFVKNKKYVTVKSSIGIAPISGIGIDTIAEKKVALLLMGGDCTVDEYEERRDYIYKVFSERVKSLLNKTTD